MRRRKNEEEEEEDGFVESGGRRFRTVRRTKEDGLKEE